MGAYVVRTSNSNDKHICQLFRMGLRDKTTPTLTTPPLIRSNMSCAGSYHLSSLAFLSSSISTANLSRLVAASFSSHTLLSSSVSMANLSCLLATSSLRLLSNSLLPTHFNLLRVSRRCFLWFLFSRLILRLSFLCLQSLKLCLLVSHFYVNVSFLSMLKLL